MAYESLLERIERDWAQRGWSPESLRSFRMEDPPDPPEEDDDDDDDDDDDSGDGNDTPVIENGVVKVSQKAMTKLMQRERTKGKRSASRELLKKYGFKSEDELKAVLEERKQRETANLSDAEKAKQEAERAKEEAEVEKTTAKKERFETRLERRLVRAGISEKRIEKAIRLMDLDDYDMEDDDLSDEVETFMKEYPEWFTAEDDEEKSKRKPKSPGTKIPGQPRKPGEPSAADKAKERLAKRHPTKVKSNT